MDKFRIFGCDIISTNKYSAMEYIGNCIYRNRGGYICFCNVHTAVTAFKDSTYKDILNESLMTLPDGRPIFSIGKKSYKGTKHIPGPDFMEYMVKKEEEVCINIGVEFRHYLLGSTNEVLDRLYANLLEMNSVLKIVGKYSPPIGEFDMEIEKDIENKIRCSKANIIWVGLGAPRQERWMSQISSRLPNVIFLGVGAAFDFHSGNKTRSPKWMSNIGLEWFYRLITEPKRLWKRYLLTNVFFVKQRVIDFFFKARRDS